MPHGETWEGPLTLRPKILVVMVVPVAVLVVATFALLAASRDATDALNAERRAAALRTAYEQVLVDLTDAETGTRGYVLTGEISFLEPYELSRDRLPADMRTLDELSSDSDVVNELQVLATQRLSILQTMQIFAPINDLTNHSQLIGLMTTGKAAMDEIRDLLAREEAATASALADRQRTLDASHQRSFMIGIVGMPLGVLASLILITLFTEGLVTRIRRTEAIARDWTTACRSASRAHPTTSSGSSSGYWCAAARGSSSCRASSDGWARRTR